VTLALVLIVIAGWQPVAPPTAESSAIWTEDDHAAFTDLLYHDGRFYCAFREGERHVHGRDGRIRVIASDDGLDWESVTLLARPGTDLRDPKLSVTPGGSLMLVMGGSVYEDRELVRRDPLVAFSARGRSFSGPLLARIDPSIRSANDWLWRITWHDGVAWGVVYQLREGGDSSTHLVRSDDGVRFEHVRTFAVGGMPNETTLRFDAHGRMIALMRHEGDGRLGRVGVAEAPYLEWDWARLPVRLGGPDFVILDDGRLIAGSRRYPAEDGGQTRTVIAEFDTGGSWNPLVLLPSAGDTSSPGMLIHEDELWVSYYSSHQGRTAIYLATLPLEDLVRP